MGVKRWNGSAYTDLDIPKVNNVAPKAAYYWNGSAFVKIWPPLYSFSEPWNTNAALTNAAYTPNWTHYASSGINLTVTSGQLTTTTNTTDATYKPRAVHNNETNTDDQKVQTTIATAPTAQSSVIFLHSALDGLSHVGVNFSTNSSEYGIYTWVSGAFTRRTSIGGWANGQTVALEATDMGSYFRYTVYRNGTSVGTWDDTTNIMPSGAGRRYTGVMIFFNRIAFTNTLGARQDNWSVADV